MNKSFSQVFWRKVREEMRMEIILEKKPSKPLKLYELTEEEMNIRLNEVTLWSPDNKTLYEQIQENGFADFICNREYLLEAYQNIVFDSEDIEEIDASLLLLKNLKFLRLNHNLIKCVQHLPINLVELHLFNNPISSLSLIKNNSLQYLGLGYCQLTDEAIQVIPKFLPSLLALDLTHNRLCDLEYSVEACKKLTNLKVLSLYGNPLVLMPQYFNYITDTLINLKYFDEQKFLDIKNKIIQEAQEKQAKIQEALRKQQEELELQQKLLADKNKKGAKPPPPAKQQQAEVVQPPTLQIVDEPPKINIFEIREFKISFRVLTLENLEGVLLDRFTYPLMETQPRSFQSKYVAEIRFNGKAIQSPEVLLEAGIIENDIGRINFEFPYAETSAPELSIRAAIEAGALIVVYVEEPKLVLNEEGEKKPILDNDLPEQEKRVLGVCKITPDWLRGQNKRLAKRYKLFKKDTIESAEHWFRYANEKEQLELRREFIEKEVQQELEQKRAQQQLIEQRREQTKGKGKDAKKKDDKKAVKKGKDDPPPKQVPIPDFEVDDRQFIYVNPTKIHRCTNMVLAVELELGY